jgi:hypothetical protein
MESIGFVLMIVGGIVAFGSGIWLLVVAFQESPLWGLGCIVVPFVSLVFVISHWEDAQKPFLFQILGLAALVWGRINRWSKCDLVL